MQIASSLLLRNAFLNLMGQGVPLLVAIIAIPFLIDGLGTERFGVLTLAWAVVGYFGLFDLGLGRALTQQVAEKSAAGGDLEIPALVWSSQVLMLFLGLAGMLVLGLLSPWLVRDVLKIPELLQPESLRSFYMLAFSLPVVISTAGFRGFLEARQRFDLVNVIRLWMGIFTFLGPLLVLPFSQSLFPVVALLATGRLIAWFVHLRFCFSIMPSLAHGVALKRRAVAPLMRFGGWMTVTNVIGPLLVYLDRFLIGAMVSMAAVAYYATPYEFVTKLWLIPGALVGVLFPAFAVCFVQDRDRVALLFTRGVKYVFLGLFPVTLLIVTLAHEGLELWLGGEFAQNSTRVLQWLTVGVFINSLGQVPFALVQGAGRPYLTARFHLIELPFYLLAVWWLISAYGIEGAAIAWVARVAVDTLFLFGMARRLLPSSPATVQRMAFTMGVALFTLALALLPVGLAMKGLFLLLALFAFTLAVWFLILAPEERALVQNRLRIIHALN